MPVPFITIITASACFLSAVFAFATVLVVLWQSARRTENLLVALYGATVFCWAIINFAYMSIGAVTHQGSAWMLHGVALSLTSNSVAFFAMATHYASAWRRGWVQWGLGVGIALLAIFAWGLHAGVMITPPQFQDGHMMSRLLPPGRAVGTALGLFLPAGVIALHRSRAPRARSIMLGGIVGTVGFLSRLIPSLLPYPIGIVLAAVSSVIFAHAILTEQLFDPVANRNRELVRFADELRAGEQKLAALIDNTQDLVWSVDRTHRLVTANKAFCEIYMRSYGSPLEIGTNALEKLPADEADFWREVYARVFKGERLTSERIYERPGRRTCVEYALCPIQGPDGSIAGAAGFGRDVTARAEIKAALRRAKEEAEAASRAKSMFLASMSHELRTPLNAIIGYGELLEEDARAEGKAALVNDLGKIRMAGSHLLSLINNVLDLSKIEADRIELKLKELSILTMVKQVAETVEPLTRRNGNELSVDCPEDIGVMRCDETRLRQVLLNLLGNAAKFTYEGRVMLEVSREKDGEGKSWSVFRVRDTGVGMAADEISRLFEPFAQASAAVYEKYGGTGLGLALSKKLCALMGGDITVESEPGKGSIFTVRLPTGEA